MPMTRVITDVPQDRVNFVVSLIRFDGGTVELQPEADGEVTIIATFPDEPSPMIAEAAPDSSEFSWMKVAEAELGVQEDATGSNPRIEAYHATTRGGSAPDSVHWCSSFVNFCVERAGFKGTDSKASRSWLNWGQEAADFVPGCIVVLKRGAPPMGHVGFFVGSEAGRIHLLGGNQGNKVGIAAFDADRVLARRVAAQGTA